MATSDADMPSHKALNEDIEEIAKHLSHLRSDVEALLGAFGATGSHQAAALQDRADEMVGDVEHAIRRAPLKSLCIALGVGFVLGVVMGR
jgi:ElaB/YqjD/DUF883 family membrane-anchored ribosome-binding protein